MSRSQSGSQSRSRSLSEGKVEGEDKDGDKGEDKGESDDDEGEPGSEPEYDEVVQGLALSGRVDRSPDAGTGDADGKEKFPDISEEMDVE